MLTDIIAYLPSIIGIVIISLLVILRNSTPIFRIFSLMAFLMSVWLFFQLLTEVFISTNTGLAMIRIGTTIPNFIVYFFLLFAHEYTGAKMSLRKKIILALPPLILTPFSFTSLIISEIETSGLSFSTSVGALYLLQTLVLMAYMLYGIAVIATYYKHTTGERRAQTKLILTSFTVPLVGLFVTNYIFPGSSTAQILSPLVFLVMVAIQAYAIIKYRLFDIRLVVVRAVGYLLSTGFIFVLTALIIFGLSNYLIENGISQSILSWVYIALTLIIAITYQPIKKIFDSLTNKLFYRDAYETQKLLNEFNQVIVSTIDLNQLLTRAGVVIEKYVKPQDVSFALRDTEQDTIRIISANDTMDAKEAIEQIRAYVHKSDGKLFVTDALDESQAELKQLMQEASIGMLVRVTTDTNVEGNGYIIMGYKKSGNMYNTQDTGVMEIIANELAIAMQNALQFDEIQRFNVTLQDTVDEKTKQLRKSNEKLKQMDETKDEFISMASHQLRTPLTSVKGYLSMVIEGDAGDLNEMQHKLLDQAFVSSQRMVYLIADLLNVSRLRTGKFIIEPIKTNLADVIQGEVEQLTETAESRDLELKFDKPKDFPELMLDETKIRQVIMNFIDNAIYYTPAGGHITVAIEDKGKTIDYTVTDDGLGVPKAEQHHLFTKFYRANNAKKARPDGTGLGLFMAKKVIVASGGSIIFKSEEGKGSTFGFSFNKDKIKVPEDYTEPEPLNGIKAGPGADKPAEN